MPSLSISPVARITFGLVGLTVSIILFATFLGVFPDRVSEQILNRKALCESIAMSFSSMANRVDSTTMEDYFSNVVNRHDEIQSIGLRKADGSHVLETGEHFDQWSLESNAGSSPDEISIPIAGEDETWGYVEVRFRPLGLKGIGGLARRTEIVLAVYVACMAFAVFYVYLRFVLKQLNPQKVIPSRVRDAFDTLVEGLVVLDKKERIVLANKAFLGSTGLSADELIGRTASSLGFYSNDGCHDLQPWRTALDEGKSARSRILKSQVKDGESTFSVSCAPIFDDKGVSHGAIASFEDVTQLELKNNQLQNMLEKLDASTGEIKRQNRELELLATRDPLTGSMNRRSFFERFDKLFAQAAQQQRPLSALMVDIDHFKSINDNHGHAVGDTVLVAIAKAMEDHSRENDIVCRYGGEEFSLLLPDTTIDQAFEVAEQVRMAIQDLNPAGIHVTASLGLSAISQNPTTPQDLLEYADKCLYVAKRNGRNQVVRWDQVPDDTEIDESNITRTTNEEIESNIPFHAVTALISALAYRDQETASHCRRVADLCVAVAETLLPMKDCYTLEIAGLLHDIGKIGVPDSILLKPGKLSNDEWKVIKVHERVGVELINTTFGCDELDAIVGNYRLSNRQGKEQGRNVPIGSKILSIVDAYDSMTSDKPYRKGLAKEAAFEELRQNAGEQFDPGLVEKVIQTVKIRGDELSACKTKVSKAAALHIGLQIERLSVAFDNRDRDGIFAIASRLHESAIKFGASAIADKACELTQELDDDADLYEIIRATNELLDICRVAQRSLLTSC